MIRCYLALYLKDEIPYLFHSCLNVKIDQKIDRYSKKLPPWDTIGGPFRADNSDDWHKEL